MNLVNNDKPWQRNILVSSLVNQWQISYVPYLTGEPYLTSGLVWRKFLLHWSFCSYTETADI